MADIYDYNSNEDDLMQAHHISSSARNDALTQSTPTKSLKRKRGDKLKPYLAPKIISPPEHDSPEAVIFPKQVEDLRHDRGSQGVPDLVQRHILDVITPSKEGTNRGAGHDAEAIEDQFQKSLTKDVEEQCRIQTNDASRVPAGAGTPKLSNQYSSTDRMTRSSRTPAALAESQSSAGTTAARATRSRKEPLTRPLDMGSKNKKRRATSVTSNSREEDELTTSKDAFGTNGIEGEARDLLATPQGRKSIKRVLVGNAAIADADDDDIVDSPSRNASNRRAVSRKTPRTNRPDSAKRQLFSAERPQSPTSPAKRSLVQDQSLELVSVTSPQKTRINQLQLQTTPIKSPLSTPKHTPAKTSPKKRTVAALPKFEPYPGHVPLIKYHIISKLAGKTALPLLNRADQYAAVHGLLRETILRSESNSALLLGPPSTGKSLVVDTALKSFKAAGEEFLVVRLNGLIQTDDKSALRAIARQLQPDNEDIANADIMTALIAILSHPRDYGESGEPVSTIILLDHFDKFTQHPRQTLLYNLFDIAQSRKAPICVLGMTTKVDSYEALEKRVKSRFSHRVIQFHALNFDQYRSLALSSMQSTLQLSDPVLVDMDETEKHSLNEYVATWNKYVEESHDLNEFVRYVYLTTSDIKYFFAGLLPHLASLGRVQDSQVPMSFPSFDSLLPQADDLSTQSKAELLQRMSTLALGLLIAAARIVLKSGVVNFSTTFDEFHQLSSKSVISQRTTGIVNSRVYSGQVCLRPWEALLQEGLIVPTKSTGGGGKATGKGWEFRSVTLEVGLHHIQTAVKAGAIKIPSVMNSWLTLG